MLKSDSIIRFAVVADIRSTEYSFIKDLRTEDYVLIVNQFLRIHSTQFMVFRKKHTWRFAIRINAIYSIDSLDIYRRDIVYTE